MRAQDEVERLQRKIADGSMSPDEPLFIVRGQDCTGSATVMLWVAGVLELGTPDCKQREALGIAHKMKDWEPKQIPGRPETLGWKFGPLGFPLDEGRD